MQFSIDTGVIDEKIGSNRTLAIVGAIKCKSTNTC